MRKKDTFHFKKFSIGHDRCTMKVGTDGVLLGAWADVRHATQILDIGTGSGVIALILAQRTTDDTYIDAVELLHEDAHQAMENVFMSPWKNRIKIHSLPVQEFASEKKYDLIISNPPFFMDSQAPPDKKRHQARHAVTLTYDELSDTVVRLLKKTGRFNVILPFTEGLRFISQVKNSGLFCSRQFGFKSRKEKPIERWLLEFTLQPADKETGEITLYNEFNEWSEEYRRLTKAFYLNA